MVERWVREVVLEEVVDALQSAVGLKKGPIPPEEPEIIIERTGHRTSPVTLPEFNANRPGKLFVAVKVKFMGSLPGDAADRAWKACQTLGLRLSLQPEANGSMLLVASGEFERVSEQKMTYPEPPRELTPAETLSIRSKVVEISGGTKAPKARIRTFKPGERAKIKDELQKRRAKR